ncbi:hypothetical protein ACFY71_32570 [Streptomyces cinerochromogenes]|uniref:Integral membrane protein n=1 Tax=Streptomyces cinerochromogenes TaxID=66422 RepID=A0ABW7BIL2_9ACTN
MSEFGTAAGTVPPGGAVRGKRAGSPARRAVNSSGWAVAVPVLLLFGAGVAQWVTLLGVVVVLAVLAVATCLVGGVWHRAGAATLVAVSGFALTLFAGPAVYEGYMRTVGEPVDAVVVDVVDLHRKHGADMMCTVRELGGERRTFEVSQMQNCFGQAGKGDRITVREDPLGLLDPWLPHGPDDQDTSEITAATTAGLTVVVGASVFYGGQRRRNR